MDNWTSNPIGGVAKLSIKLVRRTSVLEIDDLCFLSLYFELCYLLQLEIRGKSVLLMFMSHLFHPFSLLVVVGTTTWLLMFKFETHLLDFIFVFILWVCIHNVVTKKLFDGQSFIYLITYSLLYTTRWQHHKTVYMCVSCRASCSFGYPDTCLCNLSQIFIFSNSVSADCSLHYHSFILCQIQNLYHKIENHIRRFNI